MVTVAAVPATANSAVWGEAGHLIIGDAAAAALPPEMPQFFRDAQPRLSYLNPEPDRWRDRKETDLDPALNGAQANEHFIDLEAVPCSALKSLNRYSVLEFLPAPCGPGHRPGTPPDLKPGAPP